MYFDSFFVRISRNKRFKNSPNVIFVAELVAPLLQALFGVDFVRVENVIVLEVAETGRGRIAPSAVRELIPVGCATNVALRSNTPKDRSHVLGLSLLAVGLLPGQLACQRRMSVPQTELLEDLSDGYLSVERVEMQTVSNVIV